MVSLDGERRAELWFDASAEYTMMRGKKRERKSFGVQILFQTEARIAFKDAGHWTVICLILSISMEFVTQYRGGALARSSSQMNASFRNTFSCDGSVDDEAGN